MAGWIDMFRSLGEALLQVWRAELDTLQQDFQRSGRYLGLALGFLGAAAVLGFWIVGLLLFALVALLHIWLPWWGASLIVLALFVLAAAILANLGVKRLKNVESPITTVRRRVDNHLDWWQHGLLAQPKTLDVEPAVTASTEDLS
jgi:putative superfamily III holin-X